MQSHTHPHLTAAHHPNCPPSQVTGWTKKLPTYLPWLTRNSPYYNLISDESQVWQGECGGGKQGCASEPAQGGLAPAAYDCLQLLYSAYPGTFELS